MIKYIILFSFFLSNYSYGQKDIKTTINEYLKLVEEKNNEKGLEYIYPKFFEIVPKKVMLDYLDKSIHNPDVEISIFDNRVENIGEIKLIDSLYCSRVTYSFNMTMVYKKNKETDTNTFDTQNATLNIFKKMYGQENVFFDSLKNMYTIHLKKEMIAIKNTKLNEWKFIGLEENLKPILKKILPEEVLKL